MTFCQGILSPIAIAKWYLDKKSRYGAHLLPTSSRAHASILSFEYERGVFTLSPIIDPDAVSCAVTQFGPRTKANRKGGGKNKAKDVDVHDHDVADTSDTTTTTTTTKIPRIGKWLE